MVDAYPEVASQEAVETRDRILRAAEKLFAKRGYEATSVREITAEAGCNVAAVNYHFRGKENLYVETFRGLLGELRDLRIRRIRADMEEAGDKATLELFVASMVNAFLEPFVDEGRGRLLMAFVSREMMDRHLPAEVFFEEFIRPLLEVALEQLNAVGPPLDPLTARLCLMSLVGQLLHVVRAQLVFSSAAADLIPADLKSHVDHVVRFTVGGIRACESTGHRPRATEETTS